MPAPTRFEPAQKRVRVMLGGEFIADTTRPLLVWDLPFFPWYYIPMDDVEPGTLVEAGETDGTINYTVRSGDSERVAAAHRYARSADLGNHVSFKFGRWTDGSKRTRRSSHTPVTPTIGSTCCDPADTSKSR